MAMTLIGTTVLPKLLVSSVLSLLATPPSYEEQVEALRNEARAMSDKRDYAQATKLYIDLHVLVRDEQGMDHDRAVSTLEKAVTTALNAPERDSVCRLTQLLGTAASATSGMKAEKIASLRQKIDKVLEAQQLECSEEGKTQDVATPDELGRKSIPKGSSTSNENTTPGRTTEGETVPEGPEEPPRVLDREKKIKLAAYSSLGVVGGTGIVLLVTGLAWGVAVENRGEESATSGAGARELRTIVNKGETANVLALASGVIATTGVVIASTLFVIARKVRRKTNASRPVNLGTVLHF